MAIVALAEALWFRSPVGREGVGGLLLRVFWFSLLITLVAEAATMPLVIALFNNFSTYGVLANLLATPLVTFFLMPTVALFFLLLPLGLEHWALHLLDYGITGLLAIAHWIAQLPHAQLFLPSLPGWGVILFALGLAWLCLWRRPARYLGLPLILLGIASMLTVRLPDVMIGPEAKQVALRTEEETLLARGRSTAMLASLWANGTGSKELSPVKKDSSVWRCDALGCLANLKGKRIAFPADAMALIEDCAMADVIVSLRPAHCKDKPVIDARGRVHAIWLKPFKVEDSAQWQSERPWSGRASGE